MQLVWCMSPAPPVCGELLQGESHQEIKDGTPLEFLFGFRSNETCCSDGSGCFDFHQTCDGVKNCKNGFDESPEVCRPGVEKTTCIVGGTFCLWSQTKQKQKKSFGHSKNVIFYVHLHLLVPLLGASSALSSKENGTDLFVDDSWGADTTTIVFIVFFLLLLFFGCLGVCMLRHRHRSRTTRRAGISLGMMGGIRFARRVSQGLFIQNVEFRTEKLFLLGLKPVYRKVQCSLNGKFVSHKKPKNYLNLLFLC